MTTATYRTPRRTAELGFQALIEKLGCGGAVAFISQYETGAGNYTVEREKEIELLAHDYIRNGVIPRRKLNDALHVAMSTVFEMDVLVSWNFRHLANIEKERRIIVVNQMNGYYYPLRLATPLEVMNDENKS